MTNFNGSHLTFQLARARRKSAIMTLTTIVSLGLCLFSAFFTIAGGFETVSFYGSSHVSVRLQEARSTSDIYFRLRTRRSDSMLFLAAGRTDYCLLVLDAGRLKVHINLGAGETEIASEAPFLLNDMKWHAVNITRRGSQITIQVDSHLTKANLPSKFHELNIHFGIWLGGLAGFNEIFLGNLPSFRGCMSHITYNSEDVLARAKSQPGVITGVSWNCSEEFESGTGDPFALISSNSYVISRVAIARQGVAVKMNVLASSSADQTSDGLIFYVSGMSSRPDYLALEVRQGKIRFVAEMGSGPNYLQSTVNVNDSAWHSITLQVSPSYLSVMVDNQSWTSEPPSRGGSRHLDVSEMVYLGVEESRRNKLRSQGLIDQSFRGCIRDLVIDKKGYGIPEADITSNITMGCSQHGNCLGGPSICSSPGLSAGSPPNSHNGSNSSSNSLEVITIPRDVIRIVTQTAMGELEIMRVRPVQVAEGDSVIITPRHLAIILNLTKYGIRDSGVLFRVQKPPQEGRLEVTTRAAGSSRSQTFAALDVGAGRVRYWHNGAESSRDSIELVLRLVQTTEFLLPAYLQDERVLTLPVEITAVNDPPEIRLVPGGVLRLAEGTKIKLMPDVITSLDPDTPAKDLIFSLLSMGPTSERKGYLELSNEPGKMINTFTQDDLENGQVWYVDQGHSSSKMALKVTDGSSVSTTAVLRIETFSLRVAPETNTGLEVANVMGTAAVITAANLSFTSNAAEQGLVVQYRMNVPPRSGSLQLKRTNGVWTNAEHFSQLDLQASRIRYLLQRPSDMPIEDEFTFHVSLADVKVPSEFRFRLRIVPLRVAQTGSNKIFLNGTGETPIERSSIQYTTFPLSTPDEGIRFAVVDEPKFGRLRGPSPFTQDDLVSRRVLYKFKFTPYSSITDSFTFNVTLADKAFSEGPFTAQIHYSGPKKRTGEEKLVVKPLVVTEGGREVLTPKVLRIRATETSKEEALSLSFNITSPPSHGFLEKERKKISSMFSSGDLEKGRIFYQHDGSETFKDQVELVAWNAEANFMYATTLDFIIKGVNNHAPTKAPRPTLRVDVVAGGLKRLSKDILDYVDEDWDSDRGSLKYSVRTGLGPRIGNIYDRSTSLSRPIFQWTQSDIDAGKLVFKHEGTDTHGVLPFWVTDSKFNVNGTLEITAGAPWVKIVNMTTLAGKKGSMARLTDESIRVETNVDVDEDRILIRIVDGPLHGIIRMNQSRVGNFTLGDLANRSVFYENNGGSDVSQDSFRIQAVVVNSAESPYREFDISIFPEAYWTPLNIGANGSVVVNENSSAVISQTSLYIINPHIPPNDIVYTLTRPPRHGYLAIDPRHSNEEADDYVTMWDQTTINEGRLRYVQSESNKTIDSMQFDVTNGVQTLKDLRLDFVVVPANLILASATIIVNEGNSVALNLTHLYSAQNYFADKLSEVRIAQPPRHGSLSMISRSKANLTSFPYKALQDGKIIYSHDGSESVRDEFTVLVSTADEKEPGGKRGNWLRTRTSLPYTIKIKIIPGNDQVPRVVNNTGTWVWAGNSATITNKELAAVDDDSGDNQLVFYVVGMKGGYVALKEQPDVSLHNFTQELINQSQIIFVHKEEDLKGAFFDFEVSDGLNEANKEAFKVTIRKPELHEYEGRVPLPVFPFTQAALKPENLLVRSSDGREINFQTTSGPVLGQLLIERSENNFAPVSSFTQTDVNNGKIFYQHLRVLKSQKTSDAILVSASSRFADHIENITVQMDISVSGAGALGGLQRYVAIRPLALNEGAEAAVTNRNINFSAVLDFITKQHQGNGWRGEVPTLRLVVLELPKHGDLILEGRRKVERTGEEITLPQLAAGSLRYLHDDSETTRDSMGFSLWLSTNNGGFGGGGVGSDNHTSTWLLNVTLPVHITPVNDQPFQISSPKGPILPVVQEHWRKLSRNDLYTMDADTPPVHIVYEVSGISNGECIMVPEESSGSLTTGQVSPFSPSVSTETMLENLRDLPPTTRFTQADIDAGKVIFSHSGSTASSVMSLRVSDGQFPPVNIRLAIPVQGLGLVAAANQASPVRILQGNKVMSLALDNLPASTNGHLTRLVYNITRFPLHGKILFRERISPLTTFTHYELLRGEISYFQTDLSVANDSFEVTASFREMADRNPRATWLVNAVAVPLLKRIKEVRHFVKGFAIGGIVAPDEGEFSAMVGTRTTLNLAVLDASPLAALTGSNPVYEVLFPPKYGQLYKVGLGKFEGDGKRRSRRAYAKKESLVRVASRFSHEDIRRGFIVYNPGSVENQQVSNEINPLASGLVQADEFVFKVFAPGVQPALAIAKFNIRNSNDRFYEEKGGNEIISDGSTDPATKRSGAKGGSFRDLVTPHMSKDSLITIGITVAGVLCVTLFLVVGIRCSCAKKERVSTGRRNSNGRTNSMNNGTDPKCISNGMMDAYGPLSLDHSDSETGHGNNSMRPLMMSMSTLSPPTISRQGQKVPYHGQYHHGTVSDSGSWKSSSVHGGAIPSVPQCRVTPLCSSHLGGGNSGSGSDSGGYSGSGGGNSLIMCPLLPPTPICDTFAPLPEEIDPPEPYGFTYGASLLPPPLDLDVREEETPFTEFYGSSSVGVGPGPVSMTLLGTPNSGIPPPSSTTSGMSSANSGTLRHNKPPPQGKNQYWV